ncbi:MAG: hypothetical protein DSY90_06465, partial [Deltaproteobacteria bacterium]
MKTRQLILSGGFLIGLFILICSAARADSRLTGTATITTNAAADKVISDGGQIYLSSVNISESSIQNQVTITTTATAGIVSAGQNARAGVAALLMDDTRLNRLEMNSRADIGDLSTRQNSRAYIASVDLSGVTAGNLTVNADATINGKVTVSENSALRVASISMEDVTVSGDANLDLTATIDGGIEMSGNGADVMVGSVRIGSGEMQGQGRNTLPHPIKNFSKPPVFLSGTVWDGEKSNGLRDSISKGIASAAYTLGMSADDWNQYMQRYQEAVTIYNQMKAYERLANRALANGDMAEYERYRNLFFQENRDYLSSINMLQELHDGNFDQPMRVSKTIYKISKFSAKVLAEVSRNPAIVATVDTLYQGLDYEINSSEFGSDEAKKRLIADIITNALFKAPILNGKSANEILKSVTGPMVGQSGAY